MVNGSMTEKHLPLFETEKAKGRNAYRLFSISMFIGISMVWIYRITHIPEAAPGAERWVWILMFVAELWFGLYWLLTQSFRWNNVYRYTFKHRLSQRHESKLPGVDIFVCTADPTIEPPIMVANTVLSVMAYDYPAEKLSVYLSDDGASEFTFYAMLEASLFAKHWIPFCKKFNIEPRSPAAYFSTKSTSLVELEEISVVKRLYKEMEQRVNIATKLGRIPEDIQTKHKGFSEWNSVSSPREHQTILQVLIDGRDPHAVNIEGGALPSLVYLAREKRLDHPHNYKAGAMNALIRVSSKISNAKIILNVDCDMYSNNSESVRDALCFFMDEQKGHEIAFVQFPQSFSNLTKNDIYGSQLRVIKEVDFPGMDGYGGPAYVGTGCFHRREPLCGRKYTEAHKLECGQSTENKVEESADELENAAKIQADCIFEEGTQWGKEMGLKYGCPVEDAITGLSIHHCGWKSVYFVPSREAFLGIAPTTLAQTLTQHKRWSEGDFTILLSKYGPLSYGIGSIKLGLQMGYCVYCLWAPSSLATLYYSVIPQLYLLKGISLYPRVSDPWFVPFAYVIITEIGYSLGEFICYGGTFQSWWNDQRIWMFKRTTSYLFGFLDSLFKLVGIANSGFDITAKVVDQDVAKRYEKDIMEFADGNSSPMFLILATLAVLNLFSLVGGLWRVLSDGVLDYLFLQLILSGFVVVINIPVYQGLFFRRDHGRMPTSVTVKSLMLVLFSLFLDLVLSSS